MAIDMPRPDASAAKHSFLKSKNPKKIKEVKLPPIAQNDGLKGFNKGMTFSKKKGKGIRLSRAYHQPPGGESTLSLAWDQEKPLRSKSAGDGDGGGAPERRCDQEGLRGDAYGQAKKYVSSNSFANGASQNTGNHITDR